MRSYSLKKIKEKFEIIENEEEFILKIEEMKEDIKCLKPPPGFEDRLFLITRNEYIHNLLQEYRDEYQEVKLNEMNYVGVKRKFVNRKEVFEPLLYKPIIVNDYIPHIVEKSKNGKTIFLKKENGFYYFKNNGLKDILDREKERHIFQFKKRMRNLYGYIHNEKDIDCKFPIGLYKGYSPILFFAENIGFNEYYNGNNEIIVDKKEIRAKKYKNLELFRLDKKISKEEISELIETKDKEILGENINIFEVGEKVKVNSNDPNKKSINGLTGEVIYFSYKSIRVKFFDYFTSEFENDELEKEAL